ncbi:GMC oxidoreductase [Streptomyces sp. NPDC048179]|uniref:GMC oxidoreductase n=1 Tax=Streptomyces sp. NPDC048179 TaxID=3365506 RepID=UPI00371FC9E2
MTAAPILPGVARVLTDLPDGTTLTADVVVVGTGAGGGAVAGELARGGLDVVMVEAGGPLGSTRPGAHIRNAFPAESQLETRYGPEVWSSLVPFAGGTERFGDMRGALAIHSVGGMLSYWSHMCPSPDPDTEAEPAISRSALQELLPRALRLLWANLDIEASGARQQRVMDAVRKPFGDLPAGREVQQLPVAMQRTASGEIEFAGLDALLTPDGCDSATTVRIVAGYPVREIDPGPSSGAGATVTAASASGSRVVRVQAAVVVLAAGALGTPQLLHASGIRPQALGRYLTDHTQMVSRVKLRDDLLEGTPEDDPTFSVWIPASSSRAMHTQISRGWITSSPVLGGLPSWQTADIGQFTGVDPNPENRVSFDSDHVDGFGLPRVSVEFTLSQADRDRAAAMFADHYRVAETIADFRYALEASAMPAGTSLHLMGTHRMGSRDDGTSVADSVGRVWGYDNLYVAGNGLISTRNAGNPTTNTVALGLRTADAILGRATP